MKSNLIVCVVEEGRADKIVEAVLNAGIHGATIFPAKGTGARQQFGYLAMFVKPEKEVILIVTKEDQTEKVFDLVVQEGHLDRPGKGFAFIQKVEKVMGFSEDIDLEAARKEANEKALI